MTRFTVWVLWSFCVLVTVSAQAAEQGSPRVWFVDSLIKVFPTDAVGSHRLVRPELAAARGQHVSVQLALRSTRALEGVTAEAGPFKDAAGATLASVTVRPEGYVVVGSHTRNTPPEELVGEAPGWFPDPLLDFPMTLSAKRTQALWIQAAVPGDAQPGDYRGTVVVRVGGRQVARREIRLHVLPAVVPQARTLKVTNWFGLSDGRSEQFYGVARFSPGWWKLVANIAGVMAEHRQNVVITPLMDLIQPRVEDGRLAYDFSNFDRWVETFQHAGAIGYIEGSHLLDRAGGYEAGLIVSTFQFENGAVKRQTLPPDDPRVEPFMSRIPLRAQHPSGRERLEVDLLPAHAGRGPWRRAALLRALCGTGAPLPSRHSHPGCR